MKRISLYWVGGALLVGLLVTTSDAQSLGDYARNARKEKSQKPPTTTKKFDNDNLPRDERLSIVGPQPEEAPAEKPAEAEAKPDAAAPAGEAAQPDQAGEKKPESAQPTDTQNRQKGYQEWQTKIADQRNQVELLSRELDVMQREYKLRAAAFYADAGNRLRNQGQWDKEDASYKQHIADKQKSLDDAKQKLEDLQEQARKSGVPSGMRE